MKNYTYTGTSILTFTYEGSDYSCFGEGPHELPSDSEFVQSLTGQGILIELEVKDKKIKKI